MMKYIEELDNGDCFKSDDICYLITSDFKRGGQRLCYSLKNGSPKWFDGNTVVEIEPVYTLDKDNNVIAIKTVAKTNDVAH